MRESRSEDHSKPSSSLSNSNAKYTRMKQVAKTAIKKFGPLLLTGLAAVAEHHWLKKDSDDDDEESQGHPHRKESKKERSERREDRDRVEDEQREVSELREQVAKLRHDLKRSNVRADRNRDTVSRERKAQSVPSSPRPRPPSLVRDPRALRDEDSRNSEEGGFVRMPFAPTPPMSFPAPFEQGVFVEQEEERERERAVPRPRQRYDPPRWRGSSSSSSPSSSSESSNSLCRTRYGGRDRGYIRARARSYSRHQPHQRHFSVTRGIPQHPHVGGKKEESVLHAGKVAAVAGLVEALHVDDGKGEWIGRKGLRVGTTAAASFGATLGRDRERERERVGESGRGNDGMRMRELVVDVGTGVLVSRLVYGRVRGGEEDERGRRPDGESRRWSYCL